AIDYDTIDYNNALRLGIFEAFVGIIQGLKSDGKAQLVLPRVQDIFVFMSVVNADPNRSEEVTKTMIALIGDLASAFANGELREPLQYDWIQALIKEGRSNPRGSYIRDIARWARDMVKQATGAQA
ncbi:karyopherin Kap95, partial [Coemansia sp. RSA 1933]